jgi:diguanylate cyclase (GGDEF)-like protein
VKLPRAEDNSPEHPSATLAVQAEAELDRSGVRLSFPPELEARYRQDTAVDRSRELRVITRIGALLYFGVGVLLKLFVVSHADFLDSAVQLTGALVVVLLISHWSFRPTTTDLHRESAIFVCCLICALAAILVVYVNPAPVTTEDWVLAALPVNFILIFIRLRLPWAAAFLGISVAAYTLAVLSRHDPLPHARAFPIGFVVALCLPALIGLYNLERAARRVYLHGLLQRLRNERLAAENITLADLSLTDPLTGVANRRRLDAELRAFAALGGAGGTLLMIDIDGFKAFNDRHGHAAGDQCLRMVAQCLSARLRQGDLLARFGGEEFAVLLRNMVGPEALDVAERLRKSVETLPIFVAGVPVGVTISIGIAEAGAGHEPAKLLMAADAALYAAKRAGRNMVRPTEVAGIA